MTRIQETGAGVGGYCAEPKIGFVHVHWSVGC